jgi:cyclopropane-fatty-acyl-phospholipid synthase
MAEGTFSKNPEPEAVSRDQSPPDRLDRWLLDTLNRACGRPDVELALWDTPPPPAGEVRRPMLRFTSRQSIQRLLLKPELRFGEFHASGDIEVYGDLAELMEQIYAGMRRAKQSQGPLRRALGHALQRRARPNHPDGSKENIHSHYDLGNDFYALWLDADYMQYTCAYYPTWQTSLADAQVAKLEHVCRKLNLKPGERVIEAGGGWGGLARYMATHHGVSVRSYNISREQVAYARERARAEGLDDRLEYIEDDYRNITGICDAFVSVGMLEHVGLENYGALSAVIDRTLTDEGRGLVHSIGQLTHRPLNEWIERYIFPGAYPPTLAEMLGVIGADDFKIMDVENLRAHYAQTLQHWREGFEANAEEVEKRFGPEFVRAWRLYLAGSRASFSAGEMQLYQILFERNWSNRLPATLDRLYRTP